MQVAKEILAGGNWLALTVNSEPYDQKPPLPFWMFAAMLRVSGGEISSWALRLPSVLAAVLAVLCIHSMARRRFGGKAAFLAGLIFLSSPLVIKQAPTARLDMLFTGWVTLALWSWIAREGGGPLAWRRALVFWGALAAAFFTKGPLAFVIVLAAPLWESWRLRSWHPWRSLRPLAGIPIVLSLVAGWLAAQGSAFGDTFVRGQVWGETWERIVRGSHSEPFWYYAKSMLGGVFMPWTLLLPFAAWQAWKARKSPESSASSPFWAWIIVPAILFHLSVGKRHQYLLPLVPPLSIVTAAFIRSHLWGRALPKWAPRALASILGLGAALAWTLAILAETWEEAFWDQKVYPTVVGIVVLAVAGFAFAGLAVIAARARKSQAFATVVAFAMIVGGIVALGTAQTAMDPRKSSRLLSRILEGVLEKNEHAVGAIKDAARPKYHVYGSYKVSPVRLNDGRDIGSDWPRVIVAEAKDVPSRAERLSALGYERLHDVTIDGDPMVILRRPEPAASPSPERLKFALLGDTGTGGRRAHNIGRQMAKVDDAQSLDGVFLLGDNIYGSDPYPLSFQKRIISPFETLIERRVPFHAALGNHDYGHDMIHQLESPLLRMGGKTYYSVSYGDLATFFILASETVDKEPVQIEWLKSEVAASRARWKILLLHEPLDASEVCHGPHERAYKALRRIITGPDGIDLVFAGHNHIYERRAPLEGVTHITIGLGGKVSDEVEFPDDPRRIVGYNDSCAFGWIEMDKDGIRLEVINEKGERVDTAMFSPRARPARDRELNGRPMPVGQ